MLSSGSSPLTVKRGSMWGFLMFAGAAWLVIGWTMLRLEPVDVAAVAGPVVLFGAVCELLRALAGTRTWWLNAVLTGLFAVTGVLLLADGGWSFAAPASLVGWYLMVRGSVDVAVGIMTRGTDRVWSLLVTIGVLETGLGFFSAGPFPAAGELVMVVLGATGVLRAVADLVTALRLREVAGPRRDVLELPPERAAGMAGYAAGLADAEKAPPPRHRARSAGAAATPPPDSAATPGSAFASAPGSAFASTPGSTFASAPGSAQGSAPWSDAGSAHEPGPWPDTGSPLESAPWTDSPSGLWADSASAPRPHSASTSGAAAGSASGSDFGSDFGSASEPAESFHDRVVRTTADLDAMLAQAGIIGKGAGRRGAAFADQPVAPDTPAALAGEMDSPGR